MLKATKSKIFAKSETRGQGFYEDNPCIWTICVAIVSWTVDQLYTHVSRQGVITYKKPFGYPKTYPKTVLDFRKNFFGYQNLPCYMFVCQKCEMFRISLVNVSDTTFRFGYLKKLFGFVMTLRLSIGCTFPLSALNF